MPTQRKIVSLSLTPKTYNLLNRVSEKQEKTKSELVRNLIERYWLEKRWQKIFDWGEQTAEDLNIKSEADILRIIND